MHAWLLGARIDVSTKLCIEDLPLVVDNSTGGIVGHAAAAQGMHGDHAITEDLQIFILTT